MNTTEDDLSEKSCSRPLEKRSQMKINILKRQVIPDVCSVAKWLGRRSLACGLSLIYA